MFVATLNMKSGDKRPLIYEAIKAGKSEGKYVSKTLEDSSKCNLIKKLLENVPLFNEKLSAASPFYSMDVTYGNENTRTRRAISKKTTFCWS